ncbi:MAG: VOC family protein [Pseudomonadota bacterium]
MTLGCFSVSLAVADLAKSRAFYELLGFEVMHGDAEHGFVIMQNGTTKIGLFHGMFDGNILTFNPGWDEDGQPVEVFEDVRALQARLKENGVDIARAAEADGEGPDHIQITDPDGNLIMFDQHVPRP